MEVIHWIRNWFANLFRRRGMHDDLAEEMEHHLSMSIEKKVAEGMDPVAARKAALREFGTVERIGEECYDAWGTRLVMDLIGDIRFGIRQLRKSRGFTVVSLLTISLCVGLNVTVFSYVQAWIVNPYSYPDEEEVVAVGNIWRKMRNKVGSISALGFTEIQRDAQSFAAMGLVDDDNDVDVSLGGDSPFVADILRVTPGVWEVAGIRPVLGRVFSDDSLSGGEERVAVVSYQFWRDHFELSKDILGEKMSLDGREYSIIGVMPDGFDMLVPKRSIWALKTIGPNELGENTRGSYPYNVVARLKKGVSMARAQGELDRIFDILYDRNPDRREDWDRWGLGYGVVSLKEFLLKSRNELVLPVMTVLQGIALSVLAIGCLNIAGLVFVRGMARLKEVSMRGSLGASRIRILRQLMTESLLLFLIGGVLGIPVVLFGESTLSNYLFGDAGFREADLSVSMFLLSGLFLLGVGLLFGWLPAWGILRSGFREGMSDLDGRSTAGVKRSRLQRGLLIAQIALSSFLLILAATLVKNGFSVMKKDYGFETENRTSVKIGIPGYLYPKNEEIRTFLERLETDLSGLPGVFSVGYANRIPLTGYNDYSVTYDILGRPLEAGFASRQSMLYRVSQDYFKTMGIELVRGRLFNSGDVEGKQRVVIVDEQNVKDFFKGLEPIGATITFGGVECRVVGVVSQTINMAYYRTKTVDRALYFPFAQWPPMRPASFALHSRLDKTVLERSLVKLVREIDPRLAQIEVITLQENVAASAVAELTMAKLSVVFAGLAYALTLIGIYGVVSSQVTQRLKEIGIRLALGSRPHRIILQFLKRSGMRSLVGLGFGVVLAYIGLNFLEPFLNAIEAVDYLVFFGVSLSILVCSLVASLIPVLRVARTQPMETLRYE